MSDELSIPDLKPCPFCGSKNLNTFGRWKDGNETERVQCMDCSAENELMFWQQRTHEHASQTLVKHTQSLMNGIETGMVTLDTPADETLGVTLKGIKEALAAPPHQKETECQK